MLPKIDTTPAFLYIVGPKSGKRLKVGIAYSAETRLKGIQTGSPIRLELKRKFQFPTWRMAHRVEQRFHELCREEGRTLSGEWVKASQKEALGLLLRAVHDTIPDYMEAGLLTFRSGLSLAATRSKVNAFAIRTPYRKAYMASRRAA